MTSPPAEGTASAGRAAGGTLLLLPELAGVGGIQRLGRDTLEAFRRGVPERRLDVLVLNDAPGAADATEGCDRRRFRFALRAVALARRRPRLVFLFHRNLLPLAPLLRAASGGAAVALLLHGVEAHPVPSALERLALRWVRFVLAVSPQTAERFPAPARCARRLWPCCLPWDWVSEEIPPPRVGAPLRLLSVARLARSDGYKGVDHTIEALAEVPAAALDVVGDGDDRPRLEAMARARGVAGRVRFHGGVSDPRLRELYAGCDLFVLPSGGEGFGIVYLEAMSFGRPCVAAAAGGAPHAVREGVSGWLVPYGRPAALAERLRALAAEPETVRRTGRDARRLVETEFSFDAMVERARALHAAAH